MNEITTLIRRELNSAPTELTVDQFVDMIMEDIESAKSTYLALTTQKGNAQYEKDKQAYLKRREEEIAKIIKRSYEIYKREYYRLRYVEREIARWPEEYKRSYWHEPKHLTYVDWSMKPWDNGTSSINFSRGKDIVRNFFENRFKEDFNNKYFSQCRGWEIVLTQRPYFKLILSPELEQEWKDDEHRLADAISRFYTGSNYWGD